MKRKKPLDDALGESAESGLATSNGKRKVGFADEVVDVGTGKRVRLSEDEH